MNAHETDKSDSPTPSDSPADAGFNLPIAGTSADPEEDRAQARRRRIASILSHPTQPE